MNILRTSAGCRFRFFLSIPLVASRAARTAGLFLASAVSYAAGPQPSRLQAAPQDLAWWRQARFGMFIHWGPVTLTGREISWSRGGERRGRKGHGPTPVEVYDNLYKRFNPTAFDADEWCRIAREAGMKYLVFTAKHHDGFCMFDSQFTDYKITSPESPFRRDVVAELARACRRSGLRFGIYYSPPDWHHPDYRTEHHDRYVRYLHNQIRELLTRYGRVDILWFDGLGGTSKDWDSPALFRMIRELQPHILINNRGGLPGDFRTPEQRVGAFDRRHPWESCITIGTQWSWKPHDRIKSLPELIHLLIRVVTGDGNLLLNVGPTPEGRIEPGQVRRLREIGEWLNKYGESVYGTRGGPILPSRWGGTTCRDRTVYVHVLDGRPHTFLWPERLRARIVRWKMLTPGEADVQGSTRQTITIRPAANSGPDAILALTLDRDAVSLPPAPLPSGSLAKGKPSSASNVYRKQAAFGPDKAFDDDPTTRWATDAGTHSAWIQADLGRPTTIGRVSISEAYPGRIREFTLRVRNSPDDPWHDVVRGTTVGPAFERRFNPVQARFVRLDITRATEGPTIWEIHLFGP